MERAKNILIESLRKKGFSEKILEAFEKVKRENFVSENTKPYAYDDVAIPIESGSTISQPYTIAFMLSLLDLKQNQKVLEIGSGSGYVLSLMSEIIKNGKIYGMELNQRLAIKSRKLLSHDSNVEIINRSGFEGLPSLAPFDRIIFSASFRDMRIPYIILEQLKSPGIMVVPVRSSIFKITKDETGKISEEEHPGFSFVPMREDE